MICICRVNREATCRSCVSQISTPRPLDARGALIAFFQMSNSLLNAVKTVRVLVGLYVKVLIPSL
jgi:hypothetical protein